MAAGTENLLPSAKDMMQKMALAEADEASKIAREQAAAEAEKKALLDRLKGPSGVSDEEAIKRVMPVIQRAVSKGKTEVLVYRFPNDLCTDGGRAINQAEPGWENTLTGHSQGGLQALGAPIQGSRLQAQGRNRRLPRRDTRRRRYDPEVGLSARGSLLPPIRLGGELGMS